MLKVFFQTFSTNEKAPVDTQTAPQTTAILSTLEVIMNRLSFRSFSFQAVFGSKYLPVCKTKTTASPKRSRLFRNYALFFCFPPPVWEVSSQALMLKFSCKNQTRLINDSGNFQFSRENTPNWECFGCDKCMSERAGRVWWDCVFQSATLKRFVLLPRHKNVFCPSVNLLIYALEMWK